jgi:hypothetical protein
MMLLASYHAEPPQAHEHQQGDAAPSARTYRSSQSPQPSLMPPGAACQDAHGLAAPARPA